eukprot:TRINITY_DN3355_c0_g1_i2.p1 TRINITY_DN3355_c0_g1~~TRINITY_DN3355_c0_g1_i2.p1  ORF type:complete len:224 (-),score=42.34 TRINITY_DN3355_c0_g1_i2:199-870(-)
MGSLCCCISREDLEEYASYPSGRIYQHCFCLRCCIRHILSMYSAIFYRVDAHGGASASASAGLLGISSPDSSPPDTFRPPPRPLPYDVDTRYVCLQRDGLTRREKTYLYEESESGCRESDACGETLTILQKRTGIEGEQTKGYCTETSEKHLSAKSLLSVESVVALVEDEDVCPTCLDEYTTENPKISTQCGHHFHLGCIYEWMERSDNCPVCGKEMVFSESP